MQCAVLMILGEGKRKVEIDEKVILPAKQASFIEGLQR